MEVGTRQSVRSLPTQTMLRFYVSLQLHTGALHPAVHSTYQRRWPEKVSTRQNPIWIWTEGSRLPQHEKHDFRDLEKSPTRDSLTQGSWCIPCSLTNNKILPKVTQNRDDTKNQTDLSAWSRNSPQIVSDHAEGQTKRVILYKKACLTAAVVIDLWASANSSVNAQGFFFYI